MDGNIALICFAALGVCASGSAAALALAERRGMSLSSTVPAAMVAALAAAGSLAALAFNLGRPGMLLAALSNPSSGMFWEILSGIVIIACCLSYVAAAKGGAGQGVTQSAGIAAAVAGLVLAVALGANYVMPWRAAWSTWAMALPHAGLAVAMACCAYAVLCAVDGDETPPSKIFWGSAGFAVLCFAGYCCGLAASGAEGAAEALYRVTSPVQMPYFWGAMILGPVLCAAAGFVGGSVRTAISSLGLVGAVLSAAMWHASILQLGSAQWNFFVR